MLAVCFCMKPLVGMFTSLLLVFWPSQLSTLSWVSSKYLIYMYVLLSVQIILKMFLKRSFVSPGASFDRTRRQSGRTKNTKYAYARYF